MRPLDPAPDAPGDGLIQRLDPVAARGAVKEIKSLGRGAGMLRVVVKMSPVMTVIYSDYNSFLFILLEVQFSNYLKR